MDNYSEMVTTKATFPQVSAENREALTDILIRTQDKIMSNRQEGHKFQQYLCSIIASIGALVIGCVLAWTSPALKLLSSNETMIAVHITQASQSSWIAAWTPIGAIVGALPAGYLANKFGRKVILIGFTLPWIAMWALLALAQDVTMLYVARFISGVVVGLFCTVLPMYVTEISEDSVRGSLGTLFQVFLTIGILLDYILGIFNDYYILNYTCLGVTVLFLLLLFFIPESHIHSLKDDHKTARETLRRLRGPYYDIDSELDEQRETMDLEAATKLSLKVIFNRPNRMALIIAIGLMLSQQLSGVNGVIFFAEQIFIMAGAENPALCTIIVGAVQTLATLLSSLLVDRAGRKILLIISGVGICACLIALGYFFSVSETKDADISNIKWLPLVSLISFIIVFSLGFGPLPWMMTGEIFSNHIKGFASGVSVAANWTSVSLVTFAFQPLLDSISASYTFWLFAVTTAMATLFIIFVVPETKGKSVQQIQNELAGKKSSSATTTRADND